MRYLLDTDTCIALLRGQAGVVARAEETAPDQLAVSAITRYELRVGVLRCDPKRIRQESRKVEQFLDLLHELPFTGDTAEVAAQIRQRLESTGQPIGPMDTLIAATALEAALTLVPGNLAEFSRVKGLQVESWMG